MVNMASHPDNASPLLKACENGHDLCVKQLLDCQANPEARIVAGHRKSGSEHMVKFLDPLQCATRRNYLRYHQNERASRCALSKHAYANMLMQLFKGYKNDNF